MILRKLLPATEEERPAILHAFVCFFLLFASWYTIRPIREAMGIQGGAGDLPLLMVGTVLLGVLINPLIGQLATKLSRETMAQFVYRFLAGNLLLFYFALVYLPHWITYSDGVRTTIGHGLYIWVSAFSVLIGSLLWSLLAELFPPDRAKQLFGFAAAGCSLGGIIGSALVVFLIGFMGRHEWSPLHLLVFAALLLELAARSVKAIVRSAPVYPNQRGKVSSNKPLRASSWDGIRQTLHSPYLLGISGYVLFYTITGTFAYLIQGSVIDALESDMGARIEKFAYIDLITNTASILLQMGAVRSVVHVVGVGWTLAILPALTIVSFCLLWALPVYWVVVVAQVLRRATNYGLTRPAREMLYTPLPTEEKYLAKNLIDVGLYRAGDAVSSLAYKGLAAAGLGLTGLAALAIPVSVVWLCLAPLLGRGFQKRIDAMDAHDEAGP
jgi:ATP:ADP antiporter, AAA family